MLCSNLIGAVVHYFSDTIVEPLVYDLAGGKDTVLLQDIPFFGSFTVRQIYRPLVRGALAGGVCFVTTGGTSFIMNYQNVGKSVAVAALAFAEEFLKTDVKYFFKTNGQIFPESWQELHVHRIAGGSSYALVKGLAQGKFANPVGACELLWSGTMKGSKEIFVSQFPLPSEKGYSILTFVGVDWLTYVAGDAVERLGPLLVCPTLGLGGSVILVGGSLILDTVILGAVIKQIPGDINHTESGNGM
jgi:hypothetical protein